MVKKSFWPLGIVLVYAVFFAFLVSFFIFSRFQKEELVTRDYYEKELIYQEQIERMKRTQALSEKIEVIYEHQHKKISLQFPAELNYEKLTGNILFFRPADARQDRLLPLNITSAGLQVVDVKTFTTGFWRIKIFWQINGQEYYEEKAMVLD